MDLKSWPYRWYGVWREYGQGYENYPSVKDFVDRERNSRYDQEKLSGYLRNAPVVATTSRRNFPSPFSMERRPGSISYRTDGKWIWLDDLADYVERHDLAIPDNWYDHIKKNNFLLPAIDVNHLLQAGIQWPSL